MKKITLFFFSFFVIYAVFANDYLDLEKSQEVSIETPSWWFEEDLLPEETASLWKFDQWTRLFYNEENKIGFVIAKRNIEGTNLSPLWIKRFIKQLKQIEKFQKFDYDYDNNNHSLHMYWAQGKQFVNTYMFFWKYSIYSIIFMMPTEKYEFNKWITEQIQSTFKFKNWYKYSLFEGIKNEAIYVFFSIISTDNLINIVVILIITYLVRRKYKNKQINNNQE